MREAIRDRALGDRVHRTAVRQLALAGAGPAGRRRTCPISSSPFPPGTPAPGRIAVEAVRRPT